MLLALALASGLLFAGRPTPVEEAERLAAQAVQAAAGQPEAAVDLARRALARTDEFDPVAFVRAGRRGEVVEDEFQAAREAYRAHRAGLYQAMGTAQAAHNRPAVALRYFRRAFLLAPTVERLRSLVEGLLALGQGPEALGQLQSYFRGQGPGKELVPLFERAVEVAGAASAQVEIDRARLRALTPPPADILDGPLKLPPGARLSTGAPLRLDGGPTVFYLAAVDCRTCTHDLEELKLAAGATRVVMVAEDPERDRPMRQVLQLYRYDWPVGLASGLAQALGIRPGTALVVARNGWVSVAVKPPFAPLLTGVLAVLARTDVQETVPRKSWNLRPPDRRTTAASALLPQGLAPGEDEPAPPEFDQMVKAFQSGAHANALKSLETMTARGDGWMLPPEARYNRALLLAGLGRRDEARRILLRIGDSRFQEEVDQALEKVGSGRAR